MGSTLQVFDLGFVRLINLDGKRRPLRRKAVITPLGLHSPQDAGISGANQKHSSHQAFIPGKATTPNVCVWWWWGVHALALSYPYQSVTEAIRHSVDGAGAMNDCAEDTLPAYTCVGICADRRRAGRQRHDTVHLLPGKETPCLMYGDGCRIVCDATTIQVPTVLVDNVVKVAWGSRGGPESRDEGGVAGARVSRVVVAGIRVVAPDERLSRHDRCQRRNHEAVRPLAAWNGNVSRVCGLARQRKRTAVRTAPLTVGLAPR